MFQKNFGAHKTSRACCRQELKRWQDLSKVMSPEDLALEVGTVKGIKGLYHLQEFKGSLRLQVVLDLSGASLKHGEFF